MIQSADLILGKPAHGRHFSPIIRPRGGFHEDGHLEPD
jgi:hypothetical protein